MNLRRKQQRQHGTPGDDECSDTDMLPCPATIYGGFEIDAFHAFGGILKQPLEHVRFNRVIGFAIAKLHRTDESILKVRVAPFHVEGDIAQREGCPQRFYEVLVKQKAHRDDDAREQCNAHRTRQRHQPINDGFADDYREQAG